MIKILDLHQIPRTLYSKIAHLDKHDDLHKQKHTKD